uniref:Transmembrane protein 267 n=1 Tax=Culicoides sonorensis TaxID=179676 RepID=A0A336M3A8_CULSO
MILNTINVSKYTLTLALGAICVVGDKIVAVNNDRLILKAVSDNITHGFISSISFLIVLIQNRIHVSTIEQYFLVAMSFIISCLIDVDHFVMAKSWRLSNAIKLTSRPFMHCSTIPCVILVSAFTLTKLGVINFRSFLWSLMIFNAFSSHHIRDSTRRGLWFLGYGHTRPLPNLAYIFGTMTIPWILSRLMEYMAVTLHLPKYNRIVDV